MIAPPPLIRLGMWGLTSRGMAQAFFWGCIALGALSVLLALVFALALPWARLGACNFVGACWYWAVIRCMDRNGGRWPGFD